MISNTLEWTKTCIAQIVVSTQYEYCGSPRYRILLDGNIPDYGDNRLIILGDSLSHYDSLILGKSYINGEPPYQLNFYTDSYKLLIQFLKKYKFKKLIFNHELLEVLKVAEKISQ